MSQHLTLLGLCALAFYGLMLGTGNISLEMMPQFVISAVLFLSSGKIMRKAAKRMARDEEEEEERAKVQLDLDWPWLTGLLNWTAAMVVIGIMAIFLMKPLGISLANALNFTIAPEQYYAHVIP